MMIFVVFYSLLKATMQLWALKGRARIDLSPTRMRFAVQSSRWIFNLQVWHFKTAKATITLNESRYVRDSVCDNNHWHKIFLSKKIFESNYSVNLKKNPGNPCLKRKYNRLVRSPRVDVNKNRKKIKVLPIALFLFPLNSRCAFPLSHTPSLQWNGFYSRNSRKGRFCYCAASTLLFI